MPEPVLHVPVHVVTGFLGVGKTTAILDLLAHKPPEEGTWAVLVNEFGEVGVDGALIEEGGYVVRQVPGGCICCSAGPMFTTNLVRLLSKERPNRVFIEPSGVARPAMVIDMVRSLGEAVRLMAVITLVDPRHVTSEPHRADPTWQEQVTVADVLVATHADERTPEELAAFDDWVRGLDWPKEAWGHAAQGHLDPAWLALEPSRFKPLPPHTAHEDEWVTRTWRWPAEVVFARLRLVEVLQDLVIDGPLGPAAARVKGLMRTERAWLAVQGQPESLRAEASAWRRDSRLEVISRSDAVPDLDALDAALRAAVAPSPQRR